jgi:hypothetical protein
MRNWNAQTMTNLVRVIIMGHPFPLLMKFQKFSTVLTKKLGFKNKNLEQRSTPLSIHILNEKNFKSDKNL